MRLTLEKENKNETGEIKVDLRSKIFFIALAILVLVSLGITYWRYIVKADYIIQAQVDCDPETDACFIWECDPESLEEWERCTGIPDEDIWYYKIVRRNAKNMSNCDPQDEECDAFACQPGESECEEIFCAPEDESTGELCSDPEQYLLENPPEAYEAEEEINDVIEKDASLESAEAAENENSEDRTRLMENLFDESNNYEKSEENPENQELKDENPLPELPSNEADIIM